MDALTRRNTLTIEQALLQLRTMAYAQQVQIDGLVATFEGIYARMTDLETRLNRQTARLAGHGPTVI